MTRNSRFRHLVIAAVCGVLATAMAAADPGHEETIAALNEQIALLPDQPELYYQRGRNYRENSQHELARADFVMAAKLNPAFLPVHREMARMDAEAGDVAAGIHRLKSAMIAVPPDSAFFLLGCKAALAEMHLQIQQNTEALAVAQEGIDLSRDVTLDLYLFRAEAQRRLGRHEDSVRDLAAATGKLKSVLLRNAWIDALIDAQRAAEALPEIDRELATYRLKSTWLLRRARALLVLKRNDEARIDAASALAEITARLNLERPDVTLLCDRALAHALLGEREKASAELEDAKKKGAHSWMVRVAETVLSQ